MDWTSFFICFSGWALGGFINGISGMGAGILALPVVLLVTDIKIASLIACFIGIPLTVVMGWQYRRHVRMADIRHLMLGTIPGALLGVVLLPVIPSRALQISLGALLVAYMFWQLLAHRAAALRSPCGWGATAGAAAGFIQAVGGIGGPPVGIYAQLARWDKDRTRGDLSCYFLLMSLPLVAIQYLAGYHTAEFLQGLVPCLLGCGTGLLFSLPVARRIGEKNFHRLLTLVIGISGLTILARALLAS